MADNGYYIHYIRYKDVCYRIIQDPNVNNIFDLPEESLKQLLKEVKCQNQE